MDYDAIVVGGGAIGLAIARAIAHDRTVLLLERGDVGKEASWAAAGMLCPHSEAGRDDTFMRLSLTSLRMYRGFSRELLDETGVDVEYRADGTLLLGSDRDQWEQLQARFEWLRRADCDTHLLGPREVQQKEPALTLQTWGALFCPGDHQVHPRLLLEALSRSCRLRGVEVLEGVSVDEVMEESGQVRGVRAGARTFSAPRVIVAAGAWASQIRGLNPEIEIRPRKGQILALKMPGPVFTHVVRWQQNYFVPRRDGSLVVGATNEEAGFDRNLTAGGLRSLLKSAQEMADGVGNYAVGETWTGLRPMTEDGLPAIGAAGLDGLFYALGHYRNGILLTPVTAEILRATLEGEALPEGASELAPERFADESSRV